MSEDFADEMRDRSEQRWLERHPPVLPVDSPVLPNERWESLPHMHKIEASGEGLRWCSGLHSNAEGCRWHYYVRSSSLSVPPTETAPMSDAECEEALAVPFTFDKNRGSVDPDIETMLGGYDDALEQLVGECLAARDTEATRGKLAAARSALSELFRKLQEERDALRILAKCVEGGVPVVTRYTQEYNKLAENALTESEALAILDLYDTGMYWKRTLPKAIEKLRRIAARSDSPPKEG